MSGAGRAVGSAFLVAVLTGCAPSAIPSTGGVASAVPTATGSATPAGTTAPTPAPTIELREFTSPLYGYTFSHPASWDPRAATTPWKLGEYAEPDEPYLDEVRPAGSPLGALAGMASQPLPDGMSAEGWLLDYAQRREAAGVACRFPLDGWTDTVVGGVAARRIDAPCSIADGAPFNGFVLDAVWVIDGTGYVATGTPAIVEIMLATFEAP